MLLRRQMERVSSRLTRFVGMAWGEEFPFYYVMEFPKSGGTWLARMIADYLQIPKPNVPVFPIGFEAVVHGHWPYSPRLKRVFYLYRDGRDVAVSVYFRVLQEIRTPRLPQMPAYYRKRLPCLFDPELDPDDIRAVLPVFIDQWATNPPGTRLNWGQHIAQWADRPSVVAVSYEDLLSDANQALSRILPIHTGKEIEAARLAATVHKYSFEQQTGRKPGTEARGAVVRKGVAGDWKNHFSEDAARVFDRHFGETLVRLGYENDRSWWQGFGEGPGSDA